MNIDTFRNILDQVKDYTDYLYFHVKGEPFLHPQLDEFLDISYEKGFQVNITTNGTLINKVKDKLVRKPALRQLNFSLHSFDGNDGLSNKIEYISDILSFVKEVREKSTALISLRLWNLDENNEDKIANQKNNALLEIIEKEFNLSFKIQEIVTPARGIKIAEGVFLNQDYEFQWPDLKEKEDHGGGFCYGLRNQIAILVDGTVVPCCLDGEGIINLGNVKQTPFSELLQSERINTIINGFSRMEVVEELCRKCGYRKRFSK
jgi:radical SAM protein with 4Fe4S-binding SPASM domain